MSSRGEGGEELEPPVPEDAKYAYYVVLFQNPEDGEWDLFAVIRGYPGLEEPYAIAVHLARTVDEALKEVDEDLKAELQVVPVGGESGVPESETVKLLEAVNELLEAASRRRKEG
ncbi:MAG: hypothetical protein ABGY09_07250 [Euryarchaeota archaeon]